MLLIFSCVIHERRGVRILKAVLSFHFLPFGSFYLQVFSRSFRACRVPQFYWIIEMRDLFYGVFRIPELCWEIWWIPTQDPAWEMAGLLGGNITCHQHFFVFEWLGQRPAWIAWCFAIINTLIFAHHTGNHFSRFQSGDTCKNVPAGGPYYLGIKLPQDQNRQVP